MHADAADPEASALLARVVAALRGVPGVRALALGGSRARGAQVPGSDFDVGIYYEGATGFDEAAMAQAALALDDAHRPDLVTPRGGWGPWIDGGGWLQVDGHAVDLLYRDLERVRAIGDDCRAGRVEIAYQPGHPHGFVSAILLGEVALARILDDPTGALRELQQAAWPYPPALAAALRAKFLWEAGFAMEVGAKGAGRGDVTHALASATRGVFCLLQVLFAENGVYLLNEKGALRAAEAFSRRPPDLERRVTTALETLATEPARTREVFAGLRALVAEAEQLLGVS